jgi:hypothetical protein
MKCRNLLLALCAFSCVLLPARLQAAPSPNDITAQAGWAEIEITPPLGLQMGGRGPTETVGKKVLDPLFAQVLFLKDAKGTGFVLVSFDLVGMPHDLSDRIRLDIVHELGVDWDLVVLNTSHTHSGPQMTYSVFAGVDGVPPEAQKYFDALAGKIVTATRAAAKSLAPVKVETFEKTKMAGAELFLTQTGPSRKRSGCLNSRRKIASHPR